MEANMARTPARKTTTKPAVTAGAAAKLAHGKTRLRKNQSQRSMLDLPAELIAKLREEYGVDVQWVTDQVLGKEEPAMRQDFEINAWEPVSQDMFDRIFDGMYMRAGQPGEIRYNGLVLMWRPYDLTIEAKNEEIAARNAALKAQENMIKGGAAIQGLTAGFEADHVTVRNKFERSIHAPMEIPTE
jgi:hypothetical protein